MKKTLICFILLYSISVISLQAQEKKDLKISAMVFYGLGFGISENSNAPNYNFRTTNFDVLVNFDFGKIIGLATGIGFNKLSGNGFNPVGNFYHKRSIMRIPLLMSLTYPITEDFDFYANGGFFYERIMDDEFQFISTTEKDIYTGSGLGAQIQAGLMFKLPNELDLRKARIGVIIGAQLSSEYKNGLNGALSNTQDLSDIYSITVLYSYTF